MKRGGVLLVAVAVVAGILRLGSPGSPGAPSEKTEAGTPQKKKEPPAANAKEAVLAHSDQTDIGKTIAEFFGRPLNLLTASNDNPDLRELAQHWFVPKDDNRGSIEFVVASLPDPAHTHLALLFDRDIDVIQEAAQKQGCSFDRATMPWESESHPESTNVEHRLEEAEIAEAREQWPGLMIFRGRNQAGSKLCSGQHLFVFVVGEAPTGGINKTQFQHALTIMRDIRGQGPAPQPLYVLGPSFSGSFFSLTEILQENASFAGDLPVTIYSGSVTSGCAQMRFIDQFDSPHDRATGRKSRTARSASCQEPESATTGKTQVPKQAASEQPRQPQPPYVTFASFQESDERLIEGFARFAEDRGYHRGEIAIVSEDETDFGYVSSEPGFSSDSSAAAENVNPGVDANDAGCTSQPAADPATANYNPCERESHGIVTLHFPREISQMRAAYQAVSPVSSSSNKVLLPLDLQTTGNDDSVPQFARQHTPLSQEGIMLELATELHKHHTRLIALMATDPIDQLFLAEYFRRGFPTARVGITNPDLMLLREGDALLYGTYGVSTYSLAPGASNNLFRSASAVVAHGQEKVFASDFTQGVYNATLGLLSYASWTETHRQCPLDDATVPAAQYAGYGVPLDAKFRPLVDGEKLAPVLQVTMLGRDGYWDVEALSPVGIDKRGPAFDRVLKPQTGTPQPPQNVAQHVPASSWIALLIFALGAFFHWYSTFRGSVFSSTETTAQFACVGSDKCIADASRSQGHPRERLIGIGALVLTAGLMGILSARIALKLEGCQKNVYIEFLGVMAVIIFCSAIAYNLGIERNCYKCGVALAVFSLAIIGGGLTIAFERWPAFDWLWSSRSVHLTNGCSPLLVLLAVCAGAYWWTLYGLRGMVLTDSLRPRVPTSAHLPAVLARSADDQIILKKLRHAANPFSITGLEAGFVVVLVLSIIFLLGLSHPIQTLEGLLFDKPLAWIYLLGVCLLAWTLAKIFEVWWGCEQLLMALDRVPLRDAFSRLQGFEWASLWSPASSTLRESYRYVGRQLECLEHLIAVVKQSPGASGHFRGNKELLAKLDETIAKRDSVLEAVKEVNAKKLPTEEIFTRYQAMQETAAESAGEIICKVLELEWKASDMPVAATTPKFLQNQRWQSAAGRVLLLTEEFVALTYTAFLASVMVRLRSLVMSAVGLYVALLVGISVYPFEPNPSLLSISAALFLVAGGVVGYAYMGMHKDGILSRLTSTKEGELDPQFWLQFVGAGAIPLLTLLAGQFPTINQILSGLLEPAMKALK